MTPADERLGYRATTQAKSYHSPHSPEVSPRFRRKKSMVDNFSLKASARVENYAN
jgi:hypothetical protein